MSAKEVKAQVEIKDAPQVMLQTEPEATGELAPLLAGMNLAEVDPGGSVPLEAALIEGNLAMLTPEQRLAYYKAVCNSLRLNPLTKPFEYVQLDGKLTLYATRACTEQLRLLHGVSVTLKERTIVEGVYVVLAVAKNKLGRTDESTGAVAIKGMAGQALANAIMRAETKAKRRVTLSICGLGLLDESELDGIASGPNWQQGGAPLKPQMRTLDDVAEGGLGAPDAHDNGPLVIPPEISADIEAGKVGRFMRWATGVLQSAWSAGYSDFEAVRSQLFPTPQDPLLMRIAALAESTEPGHEAAKAFIDKVGR